MTEHLLAVAGLGNPGDRYARTLHNAGFWCVDEIARRSAATFSYEKRFDADVCRVSMHGTDVWLLKPMSHMNLSGQPVRAFTDYYRIPAERLLVAHDEIDLAPGTVRLKSGGGHGGHNGLRDVIQHCGSDFMRLRIGVGHPGRKELVTGYVLKPPPGEMQPVLERAVDDAADAVSVLVDRGIDETMKELHTRSP